MFRLLAKRQFQSQGLPTKVWRPVLSDVDRSELKNIHLDRFKKKPPPSNLYTQAPEIKEAKELTPTLQAMKKIQEQGDTLVTSTLSTQQKAGLYAIVEINNKPFSVLQNDIVICKRMPHVSVGDQLLLTKVRELGSRDYYVRGQPILPADLTNIQAVVLEHTKSAKQTTYLRRVGQGPGDRKWRKRSYRDHLTVLRISKIQTLS